MKTLILACLLLFPSLAPAQDPRLIHIYDRFEDRTRYWTNPVVVGSDLDLTATFSYRGKGAGHTVDVFGLIFSSESSDWRYLKNSKLHCLIDGQPLNLGSAVGTDNEVKTGYRSVRVEEILIFNVRYQTLEKMAKAKRLEMRLGNTELYSLGSFQKHLKVLLDKVNTAKK